MIIPETVIDMVTVTYIKKLMDQLGIPGGSNVRKHNTDAYIKKIMEEMKRRGGKCELFDEKTLEACLSSNNTIQVREIGYTCTTTRERVRIPMQTSKKTVKPPSRQKMGKIRLKR